MKKTPVKKNNIHKYDDVFNVEKSNKKHEYEIIIGVQNGSKIDRKLLDNIIFFSKKLKANIVALPLKDHNESFKNQTINFDKYLFENNIKLVNEYIINDNLIAMDAQLLPQMLNPLTGIHRLGTDETGTKKRSVIVTHTKLDLDVIETGFNTHPRIICTSGVITKPNYITNKRIGKLAKTQHKMGFVLVKKHNNKIFNLVQIEANKDSSFYFDGKLYDKNKIVKADCHIHLGDNHGHEMDKNIMKLLPSILTHLNPSKVFVHDSFNGTTVNGHEKNSVISRYRTYVDYSLSLEHELKETIEIERKLFKGYNLVKISSNHDVDWIDRRLEEGEYPKDPINTLIMHKLAIMKMENPSSNTLNNAYNIVYPNHGLNVLFTSRYEHVLSFGNICHHGDIGKGGAKGNIKTFEATLGNSISGHTHKPARYGNAVDVGHTTHGKQSYKRGLNGWVKAMAISYPTGKVELRLFVENKEGKLFTL